MNILTNPNDLEDARRRLAEILDARGEWFCSESSEGAQQSPLVRGEWEIGAAHGALLFSYRTERGAWRVWRVAGWEWTGAMLRLDATRRMGAERATLELVPRASVHENLVRLKAARLAVAEQLAALACASSVVNAKIERVSLSRGARRAEPGRYARIMLRVGGGGREIVALTGAVVPLGAHDVETYLASALVWWLRQSDRATKRGRVEKLWLIVAPALASEMAARLSLLHAEVRRKIVLFAMHEDEQSLAPVLVPELEQTLDGAPTRLYRPPRAELSETAARIVALAPAAIDAVRARHGETLRFHGLAFARVRRVVGREHAWFGVGREKRAPLDGDNWSRLIKLLGELAEHRRAEASDHRHAFYASAAEAWLESMLRRDITRLDPGLRLAPLHAQFRTVRERATGARPVDLLALRRDGRLVVIELKVVEDAALALQGADYWRRITAHQRAGHIRQARLFGDAEMSDEPPLVYLVAPMLRFHRSFYRLARLITPDIEMYRFDLNEDWRAGVRVMRRTRVV